MAIVEANTSGAFPHRGILVGAVASIGLFGVIYWNQFHLLYNNWTLADSYYSHGFLVPPISAFLVWIKRKELGEALKTPSRAGLVIVAGAGIFLLLSDFLNFAVFAQLSVLPMIVGLSLLFLGRGGTRVVWFSIAFLLAMIPIPLSLTQSLALNLKFFASKLAVGAANLLGYPMVHDASYIYLWPDSENFLLVGDVCGGLRSLISLLAIGALMAYFSQTRRWAQVTILLMSGPVAISANVFRIFTLCIVAHYKGTAYASGRFHDISGLFIFASAFVLFFTLEALLRRLGSLDTPDASPEGAKEYST
jgi:exosortase